MGGMLCVQVSLLTKSHYFMQIHSISINIGLPKCTTLKFYRSNVHCRLDFQVRIVCVRPFWSVFRHISSCFPQFASSFPVHSIALTLAHAQQYNNAVWIIMWLSSWSCLNAKYNKLLEAGMLYPRVPFIKKIRN